MYFLVQTVSLDLNQVASLYPTYHPTPHHTEFQLIDIAGDGDEPAYQPNTVAAMIERNRHA